MTNGVDPLPSRRRGKNQIFDEIGALVQSAGMFFHRIGWELIIVKDEMSHLNFVAHLF